MQVVSKIVDPELTPNRTLLQMPFHCDSKLLTATFGERYLK